MANAAFESYTSDGKLQLTSDYIQYYFKRKGTFQLTQLTRANGLYGYPVAGSPMYQYDDGTSTSIGIVGNFDANTEIVAYSCAVPIIPFPGGPGWIGAYTQNTSSPTVTYYVFAGFNTFAGSVAGLQLYDSNSILTYDALSNPLVIDNKTDITSMSSGMNIAAGLPSGRTYAVIVNKPSTRLITPFNGYGTPPNSINAFDFGSANPYNSNESAFYIDTDVHIVESNKTTFSAISQLDGSLMIADVTGY